MSKNYTVKQVAEILGYSTNSIYTFLNEKRIKGIRVGKGRFRVSQEELDRVMHLSKRQQPQTITSPMAKNQASPETIQQDQRLAAVNNGTEPPDVLYAIHSLHLSMPSLFDWFIGVTSILLGFSMFLFNKYLDASDIRGFLPWLLPLQVTFVAGGFSILINDAIKGVASIWHKIFHIIIFLAYITMAIIRWQISDGGGVALYGVIALVILVNVVFDQGSISKFVMTIIAYSLAIPVFFFFQPDLITLPNELQFMKALPQIYGTIWIVITLLNAVFLWWTHRQRKILFWLLIIANAAVFFLIAYWFANSLAWGKSIITLMMALTTLIVPLWDLVSPRSKKDRLIVFGLFATITVVLSISLTTLWLMERNVKEYAGREMLQKVSYGEIMVESANDSVRSTIENIAQDQHLLDAVNNNNQNALTEILRTDHNGNKYIGRISVIKLNGELFGEYPYIQSSITNFAGKDYFKDALEIKKPILSKLFEITPNGKQKEIVVAAPLIDNIGNTQAVVIGLLNLDKLGANLQKIAVSEKGEYFDVVDSSGERIISPDVNLIGKKIDPFDKLNQGFNAGQGVNETSDQLGRRTFVVNSRIEKYNWGIRLNAPVVKVLAPTHSANLLIFGGVILVLLAAILFLIIIRTWRLISQDRLLND